jgi:hypothetical protein
MRLYQLPSIDEMTASSIFGPQQTIYCLDIWWRLEKMYVLWYSNVTNFIITSAIPVTLLLIFNTKMYLAIRASYKNKENLGRRRCSIFGAKQAQEIQQALDRRNDLLQSTVLIGIIFAFFTCHVLRVVLNIEEILYLQELNELEIMEEKFGMKCVGVQFWAMIADDWSHLLLQVNACINFFIYGYLSRKFKTVVNEKVFRCAPFSDESINEKEVTRSVKTEKSIRLSDIREETISSPERLL